MPDLPGSGSRFDRSTAICTLFAGHYHIGLAALVNSLVSAGYAGTVWAGYKGDLPPWLNQLKRLDEAGDQYMVGEQVRLVFLHLETDLHLTNYKPEFMLDLLEGRAPDCEYLWYFDSDICIQCSWSYFADWQQYGIALCQEIVNNILPQDSPLRHKWMRIASSIGFNNPRSLNHYYSGGMVGVSAAHKSFLQTWRRFIERAGIEGCDPKDFMSGNREKPFFSADQDSMNIAAMYTQHPLTTMGPEAMGFTNGGFTMYHAVGQKPWVGSFLLRALMALPPSNGDKFFFTQVSSPIRVYSPIRLAGKRLACLIAAFIGRFYRRR